MEARTFPARPTDVGATPRGAPPRALLTANPVLSSNYLCRRVASVASRMGPPLGRHLGDSQVRLAFSCGIAAPGGPAAALTLSQPCGEESFVVKLFSPKYVFEERTALPLISSGRRGLCFPENAIRLSPTPAGLTWRRHLLRDVGRRPGSPHSAGSPCPPSVEGPLQACFSRRAFVGPGPGRGDVGTWAPRPGQCQVPLFRLLLFSFPSGRLCPWVAAPVGSRLTWSLYQCVIDSPSQWAAR